MDMRALPFKKSETVHRTMWSSAVCWEFNDTSERKFFGCWLLLYLLL